MIAYLFERKSNGGIRWLLHWRKNGIPYYSSARTKKDALEYAEAMCFIVKELKQEET